ncbi:MAG: hypothetical protein M1281_01960 [Chloroflexi bacterium]|nr:hypothetical protein [Chloroflexota bacterium]
MNPLEMVYLPGRENPGAGGPLGRYLPPLPTGILSTWLNENSPPGAWILDPFGTSPRTALEAAQSGRRILVAVNNPVTRFVLENLATAPRPADYQAALAELASAYRGAERLEPHIQSLYATDCAGCGRSIPARAFLWEKQASNPYARLYTCPYCGDEGERPIQPTDLEHLGGFASGTLHRSWALERVASIDDPSRLGVEEALSCYLPRPLYVLFTLINKLDALDMPPERRKLAYALLLSTCDMANTLWAYPTVRARPRQLAIPPRFRENNLWLALEEAIPEWAGASAQVPLVHWPEQPPETGGISLFQGRLKDLFAGGLSNLAIQAVISVLPRPNQAFWTLSALWSGWLWGREAVAPLKGVLTRRRYDWNWHAAALEASFSSLAHHLNPSISFFGILTEAEPAFLSAAFLASEAAGFSVEGLALNPEASMAQVLWRPADIKKTSSAADPVQLIKISIQDELIRRGEPAEYLPLHSRALVDLAQAHAFRPQPPPDLPDDLTRLHAWFRQAFSDRALLLHYGGGEHSLEAGSWGLFEPPAAMSLSDRVETAISSTLQENPGYSWEALVLKLFTAFPGLQTPSLTFLKACLGSYGEQSPSGGWQLRGQEQPDARRSDIAEIRRILARIGKQLGFRVRDETPLVWFDESGIPAFVFYPVISAALSPFIYANNFPPERCLVVIPGSRVNLLTLKLKLDPQLSQAVSAGWRFVKFRHLRNLADNPLLTRETWQLQIERDPPEFIEAQMNMF